MAIVALLTLLSLSLTSTGCSNACELTIAEIENLKPMIASITVGYEDGTTIELTPDSAHFDEVCDEALRIALSIDSKCDCIAFLQEIYRTQYKYVYVFFSQPVEITTCIYVPEERQEGITADENGYRIISATEIVILPQELPLPQIWAGCEAWDSDIVCSMWESGRSMGKLNSLIDDLR